MKRILFCFALAAMAAPAAAQTPRFPVPLTALDGYGACSTARIVNLTGRRAAFVSVRDGPSRRQRELGRLPVGRDVYACVRHGNWFGILYERRPESGAAPRCWSRGGRRPITGARADPAGCITIISAAMPISSAPDPAQQQAGLG